MSFGCALPVCKRGVLEQCWSSAGHGGPAVASDCGQPLWVRLPSGRSTYFPKKEGGSRTAADCPIGDLGRIRDRADGADGQMGQLDEIGP